MPLDGTNYTIDLDVAEILRRAKALIDTPEKWCQNDCSRNENRFCIVGAIIRIKSHADNHDEGMRRIEAVQASFRAVIGDCTIMTWNDAPERTHAEVMDAFSRAIQLAGG